MKKLFLLNTVLISGLLTSISSMGANCMNPASWKVDPTWHMNAHYICKPLSGEQKGNTVVCDLLTQNNGKAAVSYIAHFYQKGNGVTSSFYVYPTSLSGNSYSKLCASAWLHYPNH